MARINLDSIELVEKARYNLHAAIDATYSVFEKDGEKYFQIDTCGNSDRKLTGKTSQSIQIDRETAKFLVKELCNTFDLSFKID